MKNILKGIIESVLLVVLISGSICNVQAKELGDENGGPGVSMTESDYDNTNGHIYSYGIGPVVEDTTSNVVDLHYQAPVSIETNIENPIDWSTVDMGPTSASNTNYSLHYVNDGGPGMNVESNELGSTVLYDDGGPGMEVTALTSTEEIYVDNGPTVVESTADPRNFLELLKSFLPTSGEGIFRSYKKNTEATNTSSTKLSYK